MSRPVTLETSGSTASRRLPQALAALRRAGADRFQSVGYPTTKQEDWRFTSVAPIARTEFAPATGQITAEARRLIEQSSFGEDAAAELVFINGHFSPEISRLDKLPGGISVVNFAAASEREADLISLHLGTLADLKQNPFVALNTGSFADGLLVHLPRGAELDRPIHLLAVSTTGVEPTVSHPRLLIVAERASQLTFVESFVGGGGTHFTNAVAEIIAEEDCRIDYNRLQRGGEEAFAVTTLAMSVARGTQLISHCATLGGKLTRNDLNVALNGPGADATINGLVILGGEQHCDNHTLLDHAADHCPSHELYKHVLAGKSSCVFRGKILVRPDSQKTDSKQTSKSLLLSDDATMNSQPALEIYADDVKCTHGSTTGPVDEEMVFYLRSRGVGLEAARHLLTYAFAADVTRRIKVEPVRRRLEDHLAAQHGLPRDLRITDLGAHDEKAR